MSAKRPKIAILASGSGTTAETFIHGTQSGIVQADVVLVITNNKNAGVLERIERFNQNGLAIKTKVINSRTHPGEMRAGEQTNEEATAIAEHMRSEAVDLVLLLGYMKKVTDPILNQFTVLNTHPGLLPATRGLHGDGVQEFALAEHHTMSGQTLHEVVAEYDSGVIVAEHRVAILKSDTVESLSAAVQAAEKAYLPMDVQRFIDEQFS
jgi:phosphoribosylglycinamide formyltransferase-1